MLKNKIFLILVIVIIFILSSFFIFQIYKQSVLKNDNNQIEILCEIINDMTKDNENIQLNKSAVTNFITKKEYSDKSNLIILENKNEDGIKFNISVNDNEKERILSVTKENETYSYTQRYKLFVKLEKIEYVLYESPIETILYE